jgi:hypothetical protein
MRHWEIAWTTVKPLTDDEISASVDAIGRLGCSLAALTVESIDGRYVAVRHRSNEEFLVEFGYADTAPCCSLMRDSCGHGLVEEGHIPWNWCCTGKSQPETGLVIRKLRQVQSITGDKLLIWDDDGMAHFSWGSCPIEQTGLDPMAVVDSHLRQLAPERVQARAS